VLSQRSKYRLLGLVGQGQFGRVYCASHRKTGRLVALKELDRQRFPTHKFLRELRFLLSLQHPNIVTCHALEHTVAGRYLVMDYCEGGTLRRLMEEDVQLHPAQSLKLVADVLSGLAHAHDRGIVHCDIKPENILLTLHAQGWTARVSDFGIARLSQELQKNEAGNTGSPAYMAPERFYGQHSHSSDLYAVGILLYELLVGYRPFSGDPASLMTAHLNSPVKIPAFVPESLQAIILTALQKLSARRFRSAAEMLKLVQTARANLTDQFAASWPNKTLLQSTNQLPMRACTSRYQEELTMPVHQLVWVSGLSPPPLPETTLLPQEECPAGHENRDRLYRVSGSSVGCQVYPQNLLDGDRSAGLLESVGRNSIHLLEKNSIVTFDLPEPVQQILLRPQGCFAITQRAVYLIPAQLFLSSEKHSLPQVNQTELPHCTSVSHRVTEFSSDFRVAIESQGRWMATVPLDVAGQSDGLKIWQFPGERSIPSKLHPGSPITVCCPFSHLFQLLALDSRHIAAFSHAVDQDTHGCITGMKLEILTRRGHLLFSLHLPIPLQQVLASHTPYQLVATEPEHPASILLIDLKPLRMHRVGVQISPALITTASWGYVLADLDGQLVLLNQYGEAIGRIQGPSNPTAITILEPYGLLITSWKNSQGHLHTIDLRQLDLDIVF
jgi:serine/threonine-protein kinase